MEQDTVQIDAPDFDSNIDGPDPQRVHHNTVVVSVQELFTSPEPESIDATSTQEEATDSDQLNTGHFNSEDSYRPGSSPKQIQDHPSDDSFARPKQVPSLHNSISDEIPPLEED